MGVGGGSGQPARANAIHQTVIANTCRLSIFGMSNDEESIDAPTRIISPEGTTEERDDGNE